jgi:hypothetical protein
MRRRRFLLLTLIATLAFFSALGVILWWQQSAISPQNSDKIQVGMTVAEVEALLGGEARNESTLPDDFPTDAFIEGNVGKGDHQRWINRRHVVIVIFDDSARVKNHVIYGVGASPWSTIALLDSFCRLIGL